MSSMTYEIHVDAKPDHVWGIVADFGNIYKWSPGVKYSRSTSEASGGVGASRHCDLLPFGSVEEDILEWKEGESLTIEIVSGKKTPAPNVKL